MVTVVIGARGLGALPVLLAAAVTLTGAAAGAAPAPRAADVSAFGYCPDTEEWAFVGLINDFRLANGVPGLNTSDRPGAAADHHSVDEANRNNFSHTLAGGTSWSKNLLDQGYTFDTYRGENIAAGNGSAQATIDQWKRSLGHRANMLNPNFTVIGVGRASNRSSNWDGYLTTTFGGYRDGRTVC